MTVGRSLFSPFPPAFAAVPQYLFHITVELLPLSEPDKRLPHTSGSSVRHSVRLRPTKRVQVFADPGLGPVRPGQSLFEPFPGICLALALTVEPFEQDACGAIDIETAPFQVIRYGVIAQVADHFCPCLPEHLPFLQHRSDFYCPVGEFAQALPQLLTAGSALNLKVPLLCLPAVMREAQEGEIFRFSATLLRILPGKPPEFDTAGFLLCQFESKSFEPVPKAFSKTLRIALVLKAGQKIVGETKIMGVG